MSIKNKFKLPFTPPHLNFKFKGKIIFNKFFAFTMTEVMIVMTILGVIATIMITTIKPAEYKEKALETAAKKVMNSIDHATTMILLNDSIDGTMYNLIGTDGSTFSIKGGFNQARSNKVADLYKKYLVTTRKPCVDNDCQCWNDSTIAARTKSNFFYLKDGTCVKIITGRQNNIKSIFPGESNPTNLTARTYIYFDINDTQEPNTRGKDSFAIPLDRRGILYDGIAEDFGEESENTEELGEE